MSWLSISIEARAEDAEALSDALMALGALSVEIADADAGQPEEQAIFGEPGAPGDAVWQRNQVNALFPAASDTAAIVAQAAHDIGLTGTPLFSQSIVEQQDWVRLTQAQFEPISISSRLWIIPTWHQETDPSAINLRLDPGLAFGTGSHPTTKLCLRWLDANIKGGESVLDYGCGSGILAIAALKLGAASATGVDIDPQAVQSSRDNAAQNHVEADFFSADAARPIIADIVVANILANPLRVLAPLLAGSTKPGGKIVLSGILDHQADDVANTYRNWFDINPYVAEEGWVCLSGIRK